MSARHTMETNGAVLEYLEPRLMLSANEALWIEGEDATSYTFNRHNWYEGSGIDTDMLSGGEWLAHFTGSTPNEATATYTLDVTSGGTFDWWVRLNPFQNNSGGGNYSYSLNDGPWRTIDWSDVSNRANLLRSGIDIRFIGWTFGDQLELTPGQHELEIKLESRPGDSQNHGGIDVMALVNFPWSPSGILPPDPGPQTYEPDEWFPLNAGPDSFSDESIIDMSYLLEDEAGSHGFLQHDGEDFVFEDGTPAKFWGIVGGMTDSVELQQQQARFYAKHGINMVRQHPVESVLGTMRTDPETGEKVFDSDRLDRWDRWFSILKDNGIYMTWSLFYHHTVTPDQRVSQGGEIPDELYNELPSRGGGKDVYGMASFVQEYQDSMWKYAEALLNHVNPYTGLAYKDDPALAIVEMRNEDSIFFHNPLNTLATSNRHPSNSSVPAHTWRLQEMWHEWVADEYATDAELAEAWGDGMRANDSVHADPHAQPMAMYGAWEMGSDGPSFNKEAEKARMGDFIRFLAETQRGQYETYYNRLRELGYNAMVLSTAWKAGGPAASAANLWTDDAMDVITRHNYYGGGAGGHNVSTGSVNNGTHLAQPGSGILSSGLFQVEDKPFIMTEWTQKPPNQWKAEISPLMAFYGMGLQGFDASYQFAGSRAYMGNGWPGLRSYVTETPHYIGQFPALSFAIYNGHFEEGEIAAARRLSLDDIFQGFDALSQDFSGSGWDENEPSGDLATPTEILAIGRVTSKFGDGLEHSQAVDWDQYWDRENQVVHSITDQLTWDYGDRVVTAHTDRTQAVIGFAEGGTYDLPGVLVEDIDTEFISLIFTPLDNKPLVESEHILVTAMAQDKQLGAKYNEDGTYLEELGVEPLLLQPVQATLTFKGDQITDVRVVDTQGVPREDVEFDGNTVRIDGTHATYYYEIQRNPWKFSPQAELQDSTPTYGAYRYYFEVVYTDDTGVDTSSLGNNDLRVTGPGGYDAPAKLYSVDYNFAGKIRHAVYYVTAPGNRWDAGDTGTYEVAAMEGSVVDIDGNAIRPGVFGSFEFDGTAPKVVFSEVNGGEPWPRSIEQVVITFDDDVSASLQAGDLLIRNVDTGAYVSLAGAEFAYDGATNTATWIFDALQPPAGTYSIALAPNSVTDTAGNVLDGNGDGLPGGGFSHRFRLYAEDYDPVNLQISEADHDAGLYRPGQSLAAAWTAANVGDGDAGAFGVQVRLSRNTIWGDEDDVLLSSDWIGGGLPGNTDTDRATTARIPWDTPGGRYYVGVRADHLDHVTEGNETDNVHWSDDADVSVIDAASALDASWYQARYPDVATAIADGRLTNAFQHYVNHGYREGRLPTPLWDAAYYARWYPQAVEAVEQGQYKSLWEQFLMAGQMEGNNPSAFFDQGYYGRQNPDVAPAVNGVSLFSYLHHYIAYGQTEAREVNWLWNRNFYLASNPDVAAAVEAGVFATPYQHFVEFGQSEHRLFSPFYEEGTYLDANPDVATAVQKKSYRSGVEHYLDRGQLEGRSPAGVFFSSPFYTGQVEIPLSYKSPYQHFIEYGQVSGYEPFDMFDSEYYVATNPDVAAAIASGQIRSAYEHYRRFGAAEWRNPSRQFNEWYYLSRYEDVYSAVQAGTFVNGLEHYLRFGHREGRVTKPPYVI